VLTRDELRRVQLGVLTDVDRLCREQGLTCYLAYGTLLGAVRHGGFIPWDDDVDVMLPRADYDRLLQIFDSTAPEHLTLGCRATQPGWPLPYAKVSDVRTQLWEPFAEPVELGVNIDVFPLDPVPAGRLVRRVQRAVLRLLFWALELKYIAVERGRQWHRPATLAVGKRLLRLVPMDALVAAFERVARGVGRPSDLVGVRVGSHDWSAPRDRLGTPTDLVFEGVVCRAPQDPEAVLAAVYGDWQQLPPADERVSHHAFTTAWRPSA
jgi:lipopolysaccharide cholinephosphotransferase